MRIWDFFLNNRSLVNSSIGWLIIIASIFTGIAIIGDTPYYWNNYPCGLLGHYITYILLYSFGLTAYIFLAMALYVGIYMCLYQQFPWSQSRLALFVSLSLNSALQLNIFAHYYPYYARQFHNLVLSQTFQELSTYPITVIRHYLGGVPIYNLMFDIKSYSLQVNLGTHGTLLLSAGLTIFLVAILWHQYQEELVVTERKRSAGWSFSVKNPLYVIVDWIKTHNRTNDNQKTKSSDAYLTQKAIVPKATQKQDEPIHNDENISNGRDIHPISFMDKPDTTESPLNQSISHLKLKKAPKYKQEEAPCLPTIEINNHTHVVTPETKGPNTVWIPRYKKENHAKSIPVHQLLGSKRVHVESHEHESVIEEKRITLEKTLQDFNVDAYVEKIHTGPTILMFQMIVGTGTKIQRIKQLIENIALSLKTENIRIIAPIPGTDRVGIETARNNPCPVFFSELLTLYHETHTETNSQEIPLLLGKGIFGGLVVTDICKLPHLIIAGTTGSGKSVMINTIIASILSLKHPNDVGLILIDPKKVELSLYKEAAHLLCPVINSPDEAKIALDWLVKEMESRYILLEKHAARHIDGYALLREKNSQLPFLQKIVCIIDEFADILMVKPELESPIARIAQLARAVGIHLIIATQRPSRTVVTGVIKANFPARISFKATNRVNSQIILDDIGAEALLGKGDMLFQDPHTSQIVRVQGGYIHDNEIYSLLKQTVKLHGPAKYYINFKELAMEKEQSIMDGIASSADDPLYSRALSICKEQGHASASLLQRKLKIGYPRAANILQEMVDSGLINSEKNSQRVHTFQSDIE